MDQFIIFIACKYLEFSTDVLQSIYNVKISALIDSCRASI